MISTSHSRQVLTIASLMAVLLVPVLTVMAQSGLDPKLQQSAEAKPESWLKFISTAGGFSIVFPGTPKVSEFPIEAPGVHFVMYRTELRTFAEYGVIYADYPKAVIDKAPADLLLDEGAKGAVAEVNSQLLSISKISLSGYPGRFLKERMRDGSIMQVKMVLVGQRMYQVGITTPNEEGADPATLDFYNTVATKFLDSFELNTAKPDRKH